MRIKVEINVYFPRTIKKTRHYGLLADMANGYKRNGKTSLANLNL